MRHAWLVIAGFACSLGTAAGVEPGPRYDLLIQGGHVIDPKNGIDGVRDVAIWGGRIAEVAPDLPADRGDHPRR